MSTRLQPMPVQSSTAMASANDTASPHVPVAAQKLTTCVTLWVTVVLVGSFAAATGSLLWPTGTSTSSAPTTDNTENVPVTVDNSGSGTTTTATTTTTNTQ